MLQKILEAVPTLSAAAFRWLEVLGPVDYDAFESTWLVPTERRIESYFCRTCGQSHRVVCHSKSDIVSVPPSESHCARRPLDAEDVRIHAFDLSALGHELCRSFDIAEDQAEIGRGAVRRLGWIVQSMNQYPVYLLLKNPHQAAEVARNLLLEEERPFVLLSIAGIPALDPHFKKQNCTLFPLWRIVDLTPQGLSAILTGQELFAGFLQDAAGSVYVPLPGVQIIKDYARIIFPDGYEVSLSPAPVRRSMVRFIHAWVKQTNNPVFDLHRVSAAHNEKHPHHAWTTPRFKEDLFKRHEDDCDRLFEPLDVPNGKYRIKF